MHGLYLFLLHEFVIQFLLFLYYVICVTCLLRTVCPVNSHVPVSTASGDVVGPADITPRPFLTTVSCRGQ